MAKPEPWKSNKEVDPNFPWRTYRNEAGDIVYSIPLEAPNDIPVDEDDGAEKHQYYFQPLFGGKRIRVFWAETTDKAWAYDQKRWIDAEAQRNYRRPDHEISVMEVQGDGNDDGNRKKPRTEGQPKSASDTSGKEAAHPDVAVPDNNKKLSYEPYRFPQTETQALARVELEQIMNQLQAKDPRWWKAFYLKEFWGADAEEIAAELGVNPSRVYQLVEAARKFARKCRAENR